MGASDSIPQTEHYALGHSKVQYCRSGTLHLFGVIFSTLIWLTVHNGTVRPTDVLLVPTVPNISMAGVIAASGLRYQIPFLESTVREYCVNSISTTE